MVWAIEALIAQHKCGQLPSNISLSSLSLSINQATWVFPT